MRAPHGTRISNTIKQQIVGLAIGVAVCTVLSPGPVAAQSRAVEVLVPKEECKVKYASLYGFGLLTPWPAPPGVPPDQAPFVIGIVGSKPFPELMQELASTRKIHDRPIEVRWIKEPRELDGCQIVYVTENATAEEEQAALERLKERRVLVVGERPQPPDDYVVNFVVVDGKVRFSLNHATARARKIILDPRLARSAIP